ncbi:hypothetical protein DIJ64_11890 [Mycobacterium leprae]|uniref:Uncharacterized protein n=2 Tax=Mycobacterium leprae TaxID=1769 RepID=A0AAD0P8J2_MYCLR|nr:hypothetical protein [Mycobacterium leprae]AWV48504.1 hypothetical protein DIJ64_11890 [Mycobacterium leprae]OAR19983.1 hypothetical protein A8144_03230 [Mycobacterium leprae 3125609]OAX70939.1 hypothetical protein A3216_08890 [Mycobacterium leprae 7935681]
MYSEFNEIIGGAGSSDATLTARLTIIRWKMLLVEVGPDYPDKSRLPYYLLNDKTPSMALHD